MQDNIVLDKKIICVVGTRPEAVELAPVILMLKKGALGECTGS